MKQTKPFASGAIVCTLAAALGICFCSPAYAAGDGIGTRHEKTSKKIYADQDAEAARSRKLAQQQKYAEAIKVLQENVISPLELEAAEVDSWVARTRLAEFSGELRALQLTYGNLKLKDAENAMVQGKYDEAVALANEAILITGLLRDKAMSIIVAARGRKSALTRKEATAVSATDPQIIQREKTIKKLLNEAWSYYRSGRYDQVWQKIEEVYVLNPYNADASYLASQMYKKYYESGLKRRKADIQGQLSYGAWQWVEPVFPMEKERGTAVGDGPSQVKENDYAIQKKLDTIIFPVVPFNETDLEAVVQFMRDNKIFDPDKEGVTITFIQPSRKPEAKAEADGAADAPAAKTDAAAENEDAEDAENAEDDWGEAPAADDAGGESAQKAKDGIYITLELKNVTLRQLLDYVCFLTDLTYVVRPDRVVFGAPDKRLYPESYELFNSVKAMIAGKTGGEAGGAAEDVPMEDEGGEGGEEGGDAPAAPAAPAAPVVNEADLTPAALQNFFTLYGVTFPEGSSISFRENMFMNNTEENHRKMKELLDRLNVESPMVEVEVKSIELAETDMEELGFNWALEAMTDRTGGSRWSLEKGANTTEGGMLRMLDGLLSGVDSRVISNLNIFPDIFGSFKPFGIDDSFNLTLTINALDHSDRTEQISAPRVLVANGVQAHIKMTKAYFFPEEWEEMEVETEEVGDSGDIQVTITPPSPTFAETASDVGTEFSVKPEIQPGNKVIRLHLNPKITAYTGKDEYEVVVQIARLNNNGEWNATEERFVVWRPVIATRELRVQVDVNHGETVVIGGLSDSNSQKRLDKIPILSDIPFIGRLFQSQSEVSTRRNMLIFVTARLINNDGAPLPRTENLGNGGIPLLRR
ncbi:MAG: hypothetical protein E7043_00700 [Lentisphaerae bacterium]|nr:hypothetical protein [Lentisphaerota bacterium]